MKTYTISPGIMEAFVDVSTKDPFSMVWMTLHKNTTHVGTLESNWCHLERHGLERAFLEVGIQTRVPNTPDGNSGDVEGYNLKTRNNQIFSYQQVCQDLGKLTENGTEDFSFEAFMSKKFFLTFNLSGCLNSYDSATRENIQQAPINNISNQKKLFLRFNSNTSYAIRISMLYFQHRSIRVNNEKLATKSFDVDQ